MSTPAGHADRGLALHLPLCSDGDCRDCAGEARELALTLDEVLEQHESRSLDDPRDRRAVLVGLLEALVGPAHIPEYLEYRS